MRLAGVSCLFHANSERKRLWFLISQWKVRISLAVPVGRKVCFISKGSGGSHTGNWVKLETRGFRRVDEVAGNICQALPRPRDAVHLLFVPMADVQPLVAAAALAGAEPEVGGRLGAAAQVEVESKT